MNPFKSVLFAAIVTSAATLALPREMPMINPAEPMAKLDSVLLTQNDELRLPIVTRLLNCKRAGGRIALRADTPMGSPPPYSPWRFPAFQDFESNAVIPQVAAESRTASAKAAKFVKR